MNILLLDVDGVLVEDRGYRAGVIATVSHYSRLMGAGDADLDEAALDLFHAHGYTNEWDICPLAIGILIVEALIFAPGLDLRSAPLEGFLTQFKTYSRPNRSVFKYYVDQTDKVPGRPCERASSVLHSALNRTYLTGEARTAVEAVLHELLADPYDFEHATVTQTFQEHVLGSTFFEETYRRPPRFDTPSLLFNEDRAILDEQARLTLKRLAALDHVKVCVYTARPSLPPADAFNWLADQNHRPTGYPPEAELAVQLTGLDDYPLIAMGRMQWLAGKVKQKVESLTKPAPVQALAAIAAALTRHEAESLNAAYALVSRGTLIEPLIELKDRSVEVWVMEDATLGLHAAASAIDLLCQHSIDARLHAIGISSGGPKAEVLASLCDVVLPDVNAAIDHIAKAIAPDSKPCEG